MEVREYLQRDKTKDRQVIDLREFSISDEDISLGKQSGKDLCRPAY